MLAALLFALTLITAPVVTTTVDRSTITVHVSIVPAEVNLGIEVAMTALDRTPTDWASDTVFHQWILDDASTASFDDAWERMPPGRYRVRVTLWTDDGKAEAEGQVVEVR